MVINKLEYSTKNNVYNICIINKNDTLNDIVCKACGERFDIIFINKNNPNKDCIKSMLLPNITILGTKIGELFEYE